ncbi:MAG: quinoprotein relay system zinc metallohydrolase 2 [Alphaproteobacteria bacterium GM202ARS2]|nr:quinoprotein relay system zinc metallohydrolase 2 [Alphaproteobacteria bacterium GM202ARS2]
MIARLTSYMASFFTRRRPRRNQRPRQHKRPGRRLFLAHSLKLFTAALGLLAARSVLKPSPALAISTPLSIQQVADGIYLHVGRHERPSPQNRGDIANIAFIVGDERVLVFDSGYAPYLGSSLKAAVASITDKPIAYVITSHIHPDHIFGNSALQAPDVTFIGHKDLPTAFKHVGPYYLRGLADNIGTQAATGAQLVPPSLLVDLNKPLVLDLGGRSVRIEAWKPAHTHADVTAFDDKSGVLLTGDLVFVSHVPTFDGSTLGWIGALKAMRTYQCKGILPGHGKASIGNQWTQPIDAMLTYLTTVVTDVRALIARNATIDEAVKQAAQSQKKNWLLFDDYHPGNVTFAFAELEWE